MIPKTNLNWAFFVLALWLPSVAPANSECAELSGLTESQKMACITDKKSTPVVRDCKLFYLKKTSTLSASHSRKIKVYCERFEKDLQDTLKSKFDVAAACKLQICKEQSDCSDYSFSKHPVPITRCRDLFAPRACYYANRQSKSSTLSILWSHNDQSGHLDCKALAIDY